MFFVSRRAGVLSLDYQVHTGKKKRTERVLWVTRVLKLVGLTCLLERVRIPLN